MGPETVATLIVVAVIVLLIAYHLIAIASGLKTVTGALDQIADALVGIKRQTDPVNRVIGGIAGDVLGIDDDLEGLLELVGAALAAKAAGKPSPHKAPPPAAAPRGAARPRGAAAAPASGSVAPGASKMAAAVAAAKRR
jgi:Flp pilus assembly pilin Flp